MINFGNILSEINTVYDEEVQRENQLPDRKEIINLVKEIQVVLLPEYYHFFHLSQEEALIESNALTEKLVRQVKECKCLDDCDAKEVRDQFIDRLPQVKKLLLTDIQAIYDGDPAVHSKSEVILCYPGFYAIFIHRIAHVFYELNVPFIPRIMSEYAHEKTGIDIHPGASIGPYFCIDHGTGVVIGETATIGEHVKIYQGVTIGARSFDVDENGKLIKGGKRHPDIGNHVVIYANATILGGDTVIGNHCVIGGNVWLLHSVPDGEKVYYKDR